MRLYKIHGAGLPEKRISQLPKELQRGIKIMTRVDAGIRPQLVGTAKYKKAFFGDVDLMSTVESGDMDKIADALQSIVRKLPKEIYFSDMKIGGTKLKGRHWTKAQILSGKTGTLKLKDAIRQKAITKLDLVVPVKVRQGTRYVELTNFLFIPGVSAPFGDFLKEMQADIDKYSKKNRKLKVIKRKLSSLLWTDHKRDQKKIKELFEHVKGKAGKLATYLADCEVARLLVKNKTLQKKQLKFLSTIRKEKVTMNNLARIETELVQEINEEIAKKS